MFVSRCESDFERPRARIEGGTVGQVLRKVRLRGGDREVRQASASGKVNVVSVGQRTGIGGESTARKGKK